jgi:hypothetical protein
MQPYSAETAPESYGLPILAAPPLTLNILMIYRLIADGKRAEA